MGRLTGLFGAVFAQAEHLVPMPFRQEARLAAGVVLDFFERGPAHLLDASAGDADHVVMMRAVVLDLEARGPPAADHGRDEAALLEHLERAEHRGAAYPVRTQGEEDLVLAQVMVGLEELLEDQAALSGQAQAVLREVSGKHAHDLSGMLLVAAAVVDDELSHADRVSVWAAGRNILVITPCYNRGVKRLWPLPVLLFLALALRAAEGDEPAPQDAPQEDSPASDNGPLAQPNFSESRPSQESAEDAPATEEPFISVKVVPSPAEEGDEQSVAPAAPKKKVVPTATLMKAPKKGTQRPSAAKGGKHAKGKKAKKSEKVKKAAPAVVKTEAPVVAPAPPPPPVPAVPLTPITPRNP